MSETRIAKFLYVCATYKRWIDCEILEEQSIYNIYRIKYVDQMTGNVEEGWFGKNQIKFDDE